VNPDRIIVTAVARCVNPFELATEATDHTEKIVSPEDFSIRVLGDLCGVHLALDFFAKNLYNSGDPGCSFILKGQYSKDATTVPSSRYLCLSFPALRGTTKRSESRGQTKIAAFPSVARNDDMK
jgi:hypothetical protein